MSHLVDIDRQAVSEVSDEELMRLVSDFAEQQNQLRRECQIRFYNPASERALEVHKSTCKYLGVGGGNGASKTETVLAEIVALATGVFPDSMKDIFRPKFRGPIACRVIVESATTVLVPTILPKLQWWAWSGVDMPGGKRGHYGWIPKHCLLGGEWAKSWTEKIRMLRIHCFDPDDQSRIMGQSTIQFMSHNQDPTDFASGDFHIVMMDEPTRYAIYRENGARTMRVAGRLILSMTWPDEPGIPVDWIYDELYDKGQPGRNKSPHHDWFELWTTDNPHLDQDAVAVQADNWSETTKRVRLYGEPIRFSNRIHPLFTDAAQWWCFRCNDSVYPSDNGDGTYVCNCGSSEVTEYCHVKTFDHPAWPCVFILDPHPRRPHMFHWAQVSPSDDIWIVAEGETEDDPTEVARLVEDIERSLNLNTRHRLIDPNMGASPASSKRDVTWQDEFDAVGLNCELADDSDVGRARINEYLKPDEHTWAPRFHVHERCLNTAWQYKRYTWDEHKWRDEKAIKEKPRPKYDDHPGMDRYLMNFNPTFDALSRPAQVIRSRRKGAY